MGNPAIAFASVRSPGEDPFELEGDLLDGGFRVDKVVGEGDLSVVYRGLHEGMNAPVAIKCLNLPQTLEPQLVEPISESFREGARLHYRLASGHLHIARTIAVGTTLAPRTGQDIPYVVREWLEGRTLAEDLADRARAKSDPRTASEAVELLGSAADALAYAHAEGVCHHSLSPRNLFVVKEQDRELTKVLDFGMARDGVAKHADVGLRILSSHVAPEQLDRRIGAPCAATDVFHLALILFELVTGRPYFAAGTHPSEMLRIAETREPLAAVPHELEPVLRRALAPTPGERHPDVRAFWDDVRSAIQRVSAVTTVAEETRPVAFRATMVGLAPPPPTVAAHPSLGSCTAEVAPPVTTSALSFGAAEELLPVGDEDQEPTRDTIPGPPLCDEDGRPVALVRRTLVAQWTILREQWNALALPARAKAVLDQHHVPVAHVGVIASVPLVVAVLLFVVAGGGHAAKAQPKDQRSPHWFAPEPRGLAVSETKLKARVQLGAFDSAEVRRSLDEVAAGLESCTRESGPRGPGSIRVIVHPSGKIIRLQLGPPYSGTATGDCISHRFADAAMPAFVGTPRAMSYVFNTIPFSPPQSEPFAP
jgi:serine/threonine-protein kinase